MSQNSKPQHHSYFITRKLSSNSPLRVCLPSIDWTDVSLLAFEALDFDVSIQRYDALFFYSRRGVEFFFKQYTVEELPTSIIVAAYGPGTAEELKKLHIEPDFVGTGDADTTATLWMEGFKGLSILFIQGAISRESMRPWFEDYHAVKVYTQRMLPLDIDLHDGYVYTSPLNVEAFFQKNTVEDKAKIFAIGQTTKGKLAKYIDPIRIYTPSTPSEAGIARLIQNQL